MTDTVASYDELAGTRPRIRRDVLYTRTPTGVHFHNARGGFSVVMPSAYRFASIMVPHLTGEHTVEALCAGLGDAQRAMVVTLVGTLYARGFARDTAPDTDGGAVLDPAVAERFAAQVAYVDHYAGQAADRFLRFRGTRVAVVGDDEVARWAALSLVRNGCAHVAVARGLDAAEPAAEAGALRDAGVPAEVAVLEPAPGADPAAYGWDGLAGYDMVLVTGAGGPRRLAALLAAGQPARTALLPAWPYGDSVVIGPLMAPGSAGCWTCAVLRLGVNGEAGAAADLWSGVAPGGPRAQAAPDAVGPLAAMIGNLLGYEVFRRATGALPAETAGQLLFQRTDSLDTTAEKLLPHPLCPRCAPLAEQAPAPAVLLADLPEPAPAPRQGPVSPLGGPVGSGKDEEDAAQAALAEISDRSALVQPAAGVFTAYADEDWVQTPLKVSAVVLGTGHRVRREITAFDVHHVAGARLRALMRAAEVYAEHVVPLRQPLAGAESEAARRKWRTVAPERLATASGLGAGAESVTRWHAVTSLLGGDTALVPAAALRPFGPDNAARLVEATSAGTGAGATPQAAVARALRTALAYDALRRALRGAAAVRRIAPAALDPEDAELTFLLRSAAGLGAELDVLDLDGGAARALPVVLARTSDPATGLPRWAVAAALRHRDAVLAAVRDVLGAVQTGGAPDLGDPLLADLDPAALVPAGEVNALAPATSWPAAAAALRAAGYDALTAPTATPDLASARIHTARVLLTTGEPPR